MGETLDGRMDKTPRTMHIRLPLALGHALQLAGEIDGNTSYSVIPVELRAGRPFRAGVEGPRGSALLHRIIRPGEGGFAITYTDIATVVTATARARQELEASGAAQAQRAIAAGLIGSAAVRGEVAASAAGGDQLTGASPA